MKALPIGFAKMYFDAEQNAVLHNNIRKFSASDRLRICDTVTTLMAEHNLSSVHTIAKLLASADPTKESRYDRHAWRLRQWLADYNIGKLQKEVDAQPKPVLAVKAMPTATEAIKPAYPAAIAPQPNMFASQLVQNLRDSIKSVCKSGLKNGLTEKDLLKLLTGSMTEATEEYTADQHQLKLTAFLTQHGIDKDTALDILQRL